MKKLLGILVLGLLLSTNAYAAKLHKIKIGISKMEYCNILVWTLQSCGSEKPVKYAKDSIEVLKAYKNFYVFYNVNRYIDEDIGGGAGFGDGTLYGIAHNMQEAYKIIDEIKNNPKTIVSSTTSSQSLSTDQKIAQAKNICRDLGFKTNTEKFADCSLKMLSMQFEVKNRETSSDGGTQQKIVVNQGYSVGDAMIALSGIISDANNVRSSYGGGNCRIFQHAYHASIKCN